MGITAKYTKFLPHYRAKERFVLSFCHSLKLVFLNNERHTQGIYNPRQSQTVFKRLAGDYRYTAYVCISGKFN